MTEKLDFVMLDYNFKAISVVSLAFNYVLIIPENDQVLNLLEAQLLMCS